MQRYCKNFVGSLLDPEHFLRLGSGCHTSIPQDPPWSAPEPYQCTFRNCLVAINLNFFFQVVFFMLLWFYLFGYATWIFCQIVGEEKGVPHSKAFVHIILTAYSSARDKNVYQEPTQISRAGREREIAYHFSVTKVLPCTLQRLEERDWYTLSKYTVFLGP